MLTHSLRSLITSLVFATLAATGCGGTTSATAPENVAPAPTPTSGAPPWPAPSDPLQLTRDAGLTPETREFFDYHVHAHLDVFVNGQPARVPAGIGINIHDPAVRSGLLED